MMASFTSKATCRFAGWNKWNALFLLCFVSLIACNKDDEIPYSDSPEIELIELSHDSIRQYDEVLTLTIRYRDGDGDLGYEDPEQYALFIRDVRLEQFDGFYVGPLSPPGSDVPIQGTLDVEYPSLFLFGNGASETTRFEIKMEDRAGHVSNLVETDPVVITRE